jgi:iron-sulfur cluster repair protein YtfE (RIC family)
MSANGIDLLLGQHEQITQLLEAVSSAPVEERQASFDELRELLAVHETAEELVLRPITRKDVPGGEAIADARMEEENHSKDVLSKLEKLDASNEEFATQFADFKAAVLEHAQNEEQLEFPAVRNVEDPAALADLEEAIRKAEAKAPTHPHPSARSTTAATVLGPFAAMVDKVRDAIAS